MKIVIDTNVMISGVFFGGYPRKVLDMLIERRIVSTATQEIIDEYYLIVEEMIARKQGKLNRDILAKIINYMEIIEPVSRIEICRDPDDDKFIGCAVDSNALCIVSGDKDLLSVGNYDGINILTAKAFCEKYYTE